MLILKGGTANVPILMVDNADHITGKTGVTVALQYSLDGSAFATCSATITEKSFGIYNVALTSAYTGSAGAFVLHGSGTSCDPSDAFHQVVGFNPVDGVRLGLTALPNAAAEAAGGLYTRGTGAGQINQDANGRIDINTVAVVADTAAASNMKSAFNGNTYNVGGGAIVAASVTGAVGSVTGAVGSVTGNVGGNVAGSVASVTGNVGGNVAGSVGSVTGAVGSVTGNVGGNVTGSVGSVVGNVGGNVVGTVAGVTPSTAAQVAALLTTQITEAYRANGAAPTLAEFMSEVLAHLGEASISGTTKTINQLDHTTPAETFTLDSATDPASITRAT